MTGWEAWDARHRHGAPARITCRRRTWKSCAGVVALTRKKLAWLSAWRRMYCTMNASHCSKVMSSPAGSPSSRHTVSLISCSCGDLSSSSSCRLPSSSRTWRAPRSSHSPGALGHRAAPAPQRGGQFVPILGRHRNLSSAACGERWQRGRIACGVCLHIQSYLPRPVSRSPACAAVHALYTAPLYYAPPLPET